MMRNMIREKYEAQRPKRTAPIFIPGTFTKNKTKKKGPGVVEWVQAEPTETKQKFEFLPDPLDYSEEPAENDGEEMARRFPTRDNPAYQVHPFLKDAYKWNHPAFDNEELAQELKEILEDEK